MQVARFLGETLAPVVDLVYPPRCPVCGDGVAAQNGLCPGCWDGLVIPSEPACATCQRPFVNPEMDKNATCAVCMADPPRHDGIAAGTLYCEPSRKLILAFKHGRRIALAPMLAKLIAARLPAETGARLFVPVPLHRVRLWQRSFNQAALLARELAKQCDGSLLVDGLVRRKATPSLGGLGAKARQRVLSGAIAVSPSRERLIQGRDVVLVDDVLTSGSTSGACVSALKRAGARSVVIACFARVLDEATGTGRAFRTNETPEAEMAPGAT